MNFTVKYRGANGAVTTEVLDAASRADVFAQLKARGLAPLSVTEGGTRSALAASSASSSCRPAWLKGAVAGFVVVVVAAIAWFFIRSTDLPATKPASASAPKSKVEKHISLPKVKHEKVQRDAGEKVGYEQNAAQNKQIGGDELKAVVADVAKKEEGETIANGDEQVKKTKRKPIFKNGTDQLIYLAVFASNGATIPPLPPMTRADTDRYIATLQEPIEIDSEDPPYVQEMKKNVSEVRLRIAKVLEAEPSREFKDVLNDHRDEFNHGLNLYNKASESYDAMIELGDVEGAEQYRKRVNEFLQECGFKTIESRDEDKGEGDEASVNSDS